MNISKKIISVLELKELLNSTDPANISIHRQKLVIPYKSLKETIKRFEFWDKLKIPNQHNFENRLNKAASQNEHLPSFCISVVRVFEVGRMGLKTLKISINGKAAYMAFKLLSLYEQALDNQNQQLVDYLCSNLCSFFISEISVLLSFSRVVDETSFEDAQKLALSQLAFSDISKSNLEHWLSS